MNTISNLPNFKDLYPLVQLACEGVYELNENKCGELVSSYGMKFIRVVGDGECFITLAFWNGDLVLGIRGTQFRDGFSLEQLLDNERFERIALDGVPGSAMDGYASPLWSLMSVIDVPWTPQTWITGHSMGGIRALLAAVKAPESIKVRRVAFAPPCGADRLFNAYTTEKYGEPIIIGREKDFALNHPILRPCFIQPSPILHLKKNGLPEFIQKWPFFDESISDHYPEKYLEDWKKLIEV